MAGSLRLATLNLASGRPLPDDPRRPPESLDGPALRAALAPLADVDVLALQEVDVDQPRSHGVDQVAEAATALDIDLGAAGFAPALVGTPGLERSWTASPPTVLHPGGSDGPATDGIARYGVALLSRRPVRRWHVLRLPTGPGRLLLPIRDEAGRRRLLVFPDEPRVALAAELDALTVVSTHLSFWPTTAVRHLRMLRRWVAGLPGPVVVAGDLNLPGRLPARLLRARPLAVEPTFPAHRPRVQLDHLLLVGAGGSSSGACAQLLPVGDHRCLRVDLTVPSSSEELT